MNRSRTTFSAIVVSVFVAIAIPAALFADTGGDTWNILTYTDAYVAASTDIENQLETIENLETALETAKIRRDSQLSIEEKELDLEVARMKVRELENSVALSAVNLYIAYVAANRDFVSATEAVATAEEELKIVTNRFEAQEESERTLLNQKISLLQARKSHSNAANKLRQAKNSLVRALGASEDDTFVADELPQLEIADFSVVLNTDTIRSSSSEFYQASHASALKAKELSAKSGSDVFTEAELETLRNELEQAQEKFETATWNLDDDIASLRNDFAALQADIEIAHITLQLNQTDFESAELQFEYGELLRTDRDGARQKVYTSESNIKAFNESLVKTLLSITDLNGGAVIQELRSLLS